MTKQNKSAEIIKPFGDYKTPGPNADVIEMLKKTLEEAERGEIISIAIAAISDGGFILSRCHKGSRGMSEIVGAVCILKHDLIENWKFQDNDAC